MGRRGQDIWPSGAFAFLFWVQAWKHFTRISCEPSDKQNFCIAGSIDPARDNVREGVWDASAAAATRRRPQKKAEG